MQKPWLNLQMYGLVLFMARGVESEKQYSLVMSGPRISQHETTLRQLGFTRFEKAPSGRTYWVRNFEGLNLGTIQQQFPNGELVSWPIQQIMPTLKRPASKPRVKTSTETDRGPQLANARTLPIDAPRRRDDAGAEVPSVLGEDSPSTATRDESSIPDLNGVERPAGGLSEETTTPARGGSQGSGEEMAPRPPAEESVRSPAEDELDTAREAVSPRTIDHSAHDEPERSDHGKSRDYAVEILFHRSTAWYRVASLDEFPSLPSLAALLRRYADSLGAGSYSQDAEVRVVDDRSGEVLGTHPVWHRLLEAAVDEVPGETVADPDVAEANADTVLDALETDSLAGTHSDDAQLPASDKPGSKNDLTTSTSATPQEVVGLVDSEAPNGKDGDARLYVNRQWRGLTVDDVRIGQQANGTTTSRAERAFVALKVAEENGVAALTRQQRLDLAGFRGWGGLAEALRTDQSNASKNWPGKRVALSLGEDPDVFNQTMLSNRLESYYTPAPVGMAMWRIQALAGVPAEGQYLEPGSGAAVLFACAPEDVQRHARLVGVERDPYAVRVAKVVAPDAVFVEKPLETAVLGRNFDAVIGNVPFGETMISDRRYPNARHIHDYFIVRSLDHLRDRGVMTVITSSGTMDKIDPSVRLQIAERADLIAAFRLPRELFADQSANVTTDILVLQKRPAGTLQRGHPFTGTDVITLAAKDGESQEFPINQYFAVNPSHVLGSLDVMGSAFGPKLSTTTGEKLAPAEVAEKVAAQIEEAAIAAIPSRIFEQRDWEPTPQAATVNSVLDEQDDVPEGAVYLDAYEGYVGEFVLHEGRIVEILDIVDVFDDNGVRTGQRHVAIEPELSAAHRSIMSAYIQLRSSTRALIQAQFEGSDEDLETAQALARAQYHAFVAAHGPLNTRSNLRVYGDDAGSAEVCALEVWDDDSESVLQLADTFTQRVVRVESEPTASDSEDAYFLSIDRRGKIDLPWMSVVSGIAEEVLLGELLGRRFFTDPGSDEYLPSDIYLSGNVVDKLEEAEQAAILDDRFKANVDALRAVQPAPIPFSEISITLGSNWIPPEEIRKFASHLLNHELSESEFKVRYVPVANIWTVDVSSGFKTRFATPRTTMFGTNNASFELLLEKLLNKQRPLHHQPSGDGKKSVDEEATLLSRTKQDELNEKFFEWVARDPDKAELYAALYNRATNVMCVPKPDGSRISFPGLAVSWSPREHQSNIVAMAMMGHNVMAAHGVGAGKTFEMVAIAVKLGQLGMHSKPMIAVPNHMLGQISREAKQMFPGARVLMVTADDLRGANRIRFLARARNNRWDVVVCTHSLLNQISAPRYIVEREFEEQIDVLRSKIAECDSKRVKRRLEAELRSTESRMSDVLGRFDETTTRSGVITIDQLGIDALMVDEWHLYKNLALNSSMNVLGITAGGSQRSANLKQLGAYLRDLKGKSAGLYGFTGTPIANSMCELYVHNRILRPELLDSMGITHFDEWANRFGEVVTNLEALPEGGGFRINERFAKFVNLPEMLNLFRTFADVQTREQLKLPSPKIHTKVVAVPQSDWQKAFMKHLAIRATKVRRGLVKPDEDNMLSIATAGRKAAMDMRLIKASLPGDSSVKLSAVAENIYNEWEQHTDIRASQLVFMDLGTPGKGKAFTCYDELKQLLTELGLPASDIEFMHSASNADAKERLFAKVRSGEVRVLIGSTEKMGVSTNVQERLCAIHNVDCPWRPADIEQRLGRIARQGNLHFAEAKEYRYTTQDSFDLFMWETNKRKATFIAQALTDPSSAAREVAEEMDMGYAEVMAVTTGNPKIREKVEVDDQVAKLERKRRAWLNDLSNKVFSRRQLERDLTYAERRLVGATQLQSAVPENEHRPVRVNGSIFEIQDGDTSWIVPTAAGRALLKRIATVEARMMLNSKKVGSLDTYVGEIELHLHTALTETEVNGYLDGSPVPFNRVRVGRNEYMFGGAIRGWYSHKDRLKEYKQEVDRARAGIEMLKDYSVDATWPQEEEYVAALATQKELNAWFAAQNFDDGLDGNDPYLVKLASHLAEQREYWRDSDRHPASDSTRDDFFASDNIMYEDTERLPASSSPNLG